METPESVEQMLHLHSQGWGRRRIARELGVSPNTVRRYILQGGWQACQAPRQGLMEEHRKWAEESLCTHKGNAAVVRQQLQEEHGIRTSLRTVQRAVASYRANLAAQQLATLRYETPAGKQVQIDFGSLNVGVGGQLIRLYLFVATLGYSRRLYVKAFTHERQGAWFEGLESAFRHFGGVPQQVLLDNARALILTHDAVTREVTVNPRLKSFARYWGFDIRACAPYRARTKGKVESGVKYVKRNAIAGRTFTSFQEIESHLEWWMREIADTRVHGTTGESPAQRFMRDEAVALKPCQDRPSYDFGRELRRMVHSDGVVEVDTNQYSVPWSYIRQEVTVHVSEEEVRVYLLDQELARHRRHRGRRERVIDPAHLEGIVGRAQVDWSSEPVESTTPADDSALLRSLSEYEEAVGGTW